MAQKKGILITLEGGEGAGKSTQIGMLADWLRGTGHDVVLTREPGGTPEAERLRKLLVERDGGDWSPEAELLMMFAARAQHVRDLIKPALDSGKIVICDRFTDSTRAYQGYAGGVKLADIDALRDMAIGGLEPDLTLILDLPVSVGLARAGKRMDEDGSSEDRMEGKGSAFHEALRKGYLDIAKNNPDRCKVIDAEGDIEAVQTAIRASVKDALAG